MNNETVNKKNSWYDKFYMLVMVIYLGQATRDTACMIGGSFSKQFIPIFIPILLTIILLRKNKAISFKNKNLRVVSAVFAVWCVAIKFKYGFGFNSNEAISRMFFLFYFVLIAFVHIKVFGKRFFDLYEKIIVYISFLSIILWTFSVMMPSLAASFFRQLPDADMSTYGNTFLYLFTWMDPDKGQVFAGMNRNAGCAWEPGRFAVMLCLAILFNFLQNGIKIRKNKNLIILLVALATTFSTTGYCIAIVMFAFFGLSLKNAKSIALMLCIFIPCVFFISTFDFMSNKLNDQANFKEVLPELELKMAIAGQTLQKGEYAFSLERFPAMYFETINVVHDPILGYTQMYQYSYFYKSISDNCRLTGGLVKPFGWFGVFIGFFLYWVLFKSSKYIASCFGWGNQQAFAVFLCVTLSSISYVIYSIPIFTAVWFYGYFSEKNLYYKIKIK